MQKTAMSLLYRLSLVLLIAFAGCEGFSDLPAEKEKLANTPPTAPGIDLQVVEGAGVYKLSASIVSASTDPDGDTIGYRYAWYRNGELQLLPFSQAEVTEPSPKTGGRVETRWSVVVTPFDNVSDGASAQAEAVLELCGALLDRAGYSFAYLDCGNRFTFAAAVTRNAGAIDVLHRTAFVAETLRDNLQADSDDPARKERFANFIDLVFKQIFDGDAATPVSYDTATYRYLPVNGAYGPFGAGGYEAHRLQERECIDVPDVGPVCLHGYLTDIDNEAGARFFDYEVTQTAFHVVPTGTDGNKYGQFAAAVTIFNARFDFLWEPPIEPGLDDMADGGADYHPANDLSRYLKATGIAVYDRLTLHFAVRMAEATQNRLAFDLQEVLLGTPSLTLSAGPFCNNNLGTTDVGHPIIPLRPFSSDGLANFPGLVSDTETNANPDSPVSVYYSLLLAGYPAEASNMQGAPGNFSGGGSGAGRDRVGVETKPFTYGLSDNPNNCRRPADACTSTAAPVQAGGPDAGASCEFPNVSNDSDDATYKVSVDLLAQGAAVKEEIRKRSYLNLR